jgi:hypothetical protein
LSKSSIRASRLAAVSLAACVRWCYYGQHTVLSKEAHHEEDIEPSEDDLGRREYLKANIRTAVIRQDDGTHHANALTKGGRKSIENVHGWRKPLCQSFVAALRFIQLVGFPLKYGEDSIGRATAFDLLRERVSSKFFSGLHLVLLQSLIEDRLKVWSSGGRLLTG